MGDKMGDAGKNDHGSAYELSLAVREAYDMAGITDARSQIDVAEPYIPFAVLEPSIVEALDLADTGTAAQRAAEGAFDMGGDLPVNPSGGTLCTNPIAVTALVRFADAVQQVRGRASHQVDGAKTAVATGVGGSVQFFGVAVLGQEHNRG